MLRRVLFGFEGVVSTITTENGSQREKMLTGAELAELKGLFQFLNSRGMTPVVIANKLRTVTFPDGRTEALDTFLTRTLGDHKLYVAQRGDMPFKPKREAIESVLASEGVSATEAMVVGSTDVDFRAAINAGVLFLKAIWGGGEVKWGFSMDRPSDVSGFIKMFALKEHPWYYAIDNPVVYRSLGPFSTLKESFAEFSSAARAAAKVGTPARHFFLNSLVASLYFGDLISRADYIACVPKHTVGYGNAAMDDVLAIAGGMFRTRYLPDLIERHTEAPSSAQLRRERKQPLPSTQLSTIRLNRRPLKTATERFSTPIKLAGKTVVVFDDFLTEGYSTDAVRLYLERAGAKAIGVSWLKTINRGYTVLSVDGPFDPFQPNSFSERDVKQRHLAYDPYIIDHQAPDELLRSYRLYCRRQSA